MDAIRDLVSSAQRGDHLVFYCMSFPAVRVYNRNRVAVAGHGAQVADTFGAQDERDSLDEGAPHSSTCGGAVLIRLCSDTSGRQRVE